MRTAVRWGQLDAAHLNITSTSSTNQDLSIVSTEFDLASYWLDAIARAFTDIYVNSILNIPALNSRSKGQLVLDLEYLHVVFEDLGVSAREDVGIVLELIRSEDGDSSDSLVKVGEEMGAGKELVRRIGVLKGLQT